MRRSKHARRSTSCQACGVRDNTIAIQRAQLGVLRRQLTEAEARCARLAADAVENLHGLLTVHLAEYAAQHFEQLGGDPDKPQRIRDFALAFMTECVGLEQHQRVNVAYRTAAKAAPVGLPGTVRDVRLSGTGEPVLLVWMDHRGHADALVAAGYELAEIETSGVLAGLLLIAVPLPMVARRISEGGLIEAIS